MIDALVKVRPVGTAWIVEGAERLQPLLFLSGAKAEAQAHAIAQSIAKTGGDARVAVHDRAEQLVGTVRYFAEEAAMS
ncbi:MAG TPA: hypothetical protein VJU34_00090 [Phenylobacterium sp.]|nr:hypothetical protein [Phenylobacterium sp.]